MSLTDTQSAAIRKEVLRHFGNSARVLLFGSRVRDDALGGDIGLFVEAEGNADWASSVSTSSSIVAAPPYAPSTKKLAEPEYRCD